MNKEQKVPDITDFGFLKLLLATIVKEKHEIIIEKIKLQENLYEFYHDNEFSFLFEDIVPGKIENYRSKHYVDLTDAFLKAEVFGLLAVCNVNSSDIKYLIHLRNEEEIDEILNKLFNEKQVKAMQKLVNRMKEKEIEDNYLSYDEKLYLSKKGFSEEKEKNIWNGIKKNKDLLNWAIKPIKDKFGENDIVNGLSICDSILKDYDNVDNNIYEELVSLIYSNKQIARIVQDGYSNGGNSYLLMTLWNPNLKITEEQKAFAVDEAMNKSGTVRDKETMENYGKKLDEKGISDNQTVYMEFGDSVNPIGAKTGSMYLKSIFNSISDSQAHGSGDYDIRYWILKNPNWTLEEKQKLVMDFWADDEEYDETLEQWQWGIINDSVNYNEDTSYIDHSSLYEWDYNALLEFYKNKEKADIMWKEIEFCKQMHKLRPQQWELEFENSTQRKR